MNNLLNDIVESLENEYAAIVENGIIAGDVEDYIDTGCYILNALISGSIYGGVPANKVTAFAGESGVGKTYLLLGIVKTFLDKDKDSIVVYFESEGALTKQMFIKRGIDSKRVAIVSVATVQEFRTQILKVLERYSNQENKPKLLLCLDSLGNLASSAEVEIAVQGRETTDMSRARIIKGLFRILTLRLSKTKVPLLITNHTYQQIGAMFPQTIMGSGTGLQYCGTNIVFLSRRKEKDGTDVIGNIVHCKNEKSRLTIENKKVDALLTYEKGLNKYYGLHELAEKHGIFKKVGNRYELPDGTKVFEKQLNNNAENYYTKEILDLIDQAAGKEFLYGSDQLDNSAPVEENERTEEIKSTGAKRRKEK